MAVSIDESLLHDESILSGLLPSRGRLFVVSGPSGVGKGTVISRLLGSSERPHRLVRCTTATTRPPRAGELHGRSYYFFTRPEFEARIRAGFFIEHVTYNDHYYGTPWEDVENERKVGRDVVLEIEVRGGLAVKAAYPDAVLVFLAPPNWEDLEARLRNRATDSEEHVASRLEIAREELKAAPQYDYLIVNDVLDEAVDSLRAIVHAEQCRIVTADA